MAYTEYVTTAGIGGLSWHNLDLPLTLLFMNSKRTCPVLTLPYVTWDKPIFTLKAKTKTS